MNKPRKLCNERETFRDTDNLNITMKNKIYIDGRFK